MIPYVSVGCSLGPQITGVFLEEVHECSSTAPFRKLFIATLAVASLVWKHAHPAVFNMRPMLVWIWLSL